jgi:hypothetical protein
VEEERTGRVIGVHVQIERLLVFVGARRLQRPEPNAQSSEGHRHQHLEEDGHRIAHHVQTAHFEQGPQCLAAVRFADRHVQSVQQLPGGVLVVGFPARQNPIEAIGIDGSFQHLHGFDVGLRVGGFHFRLFAQFEENLQQRHRIKSFLGQKVAKVERTSSSVVMETPYEVNPRSGTPLVPFMCDSR